MFPQSECVSVKEFEKEVIRWICRDTYSPETLEMFLACPDSYEIKDSGSGQYDLCIYHSELSSDLIVCEDNMFGTVETVKVGFVVTISNRCLDLECYMVDNVNVPKNIRKDEVVLSKT
ncbi:Uncharacterised protein [Halioglobus japonicus]|nr:Uncharacterised protein [Halioglobus japonicus]